MEVSEMTSEEKLQPYLWAPPVEDILYPPLHVPTSLQEPSTSSAPHSPALPLHPQPEPVKEEDEEPVDIDIRIRNVVGTFSLRCHVNLADFARCSNHVYYERSKGVVMKQLRNPKGHIKIHSSGKVTVTGCVSEEDALRCAKKVGLLVKKRVAKRARFVDYKIVNILATCRLGIPLRVDQLHTAYPECTQYEPELMVGLIWRSTVPKAVLRIHTTGTVTVTGATSTEDVVKVIQDLYPVLLRFKSDETEKVECKRRRSSKLRPIIVKAEPDWEGEEEEQEAGKADEDPFPEPDHGHVAL